MHQNKLLNEEKVKNILKLADTKRQYKIQNVFENQELVFDTNITYEDLILKINNFLTKGEYDTYVIYDSVLCEDHIVLLICPYLVSA